MNRKKKVAIGLVTAGLVSAGAVGALWNAEGTGSGEARSRTALDITVAGATGAGDLYPGFADGDVYFTLDNTNPYPVTFASMTPGLITSSNVGCPATNVTVSSAGGLSLTVGANATSSTLSIPDVVSMNSGAPDACQGVTFTIAMTLTGIQS